MEGEVIRDAITYFGAQGIWALVLYALLRHAWKSLNDKVDEQGEMIRALISENRRLELNFAKSGVEHVKNDLERTKERITRLEASA